MLKKYSLIICAVAIAITGCDQQSSPSQKKSESEKSASVSAVNQLPILGEVGVPDTLGSQVKWLETKLGPAKKVSGKYRDYDVGGCQISVVTDSTSEKVDAVFLDNYGEQCVFDLSKFNYDVKIPRTFTDLNPTAKGAEFYTDCLSCGASTEPEVQMIVGGSHVNNWISVVAVTMGSDSVDAILKWQSALEKKYGEGTVSAGDFDNRDNLQDVANQVFQSAPIVRLGVSLNPQKFEVNRSSDSVQQNGDQSGPVIAAPAIKQSSNHTATQTVPSKWQIKETKDPFTDGVKRQYSVQSINGDDGMLLVGCAKDGSIGLYYLFHEVTGIPLGTLPQVATVRIDGEKSYEEPWITFYTQGQSTPQDSKTFMNKLIGHSKLAIEVFSAGRSVFEIEGIEASINGLSEVGCRKI